MFLHHIDNINLKTIENKQYSLIPYFGIEISSSGNYHVRIKNNGIRYDIGTFSDIIAAANAYNYWSIKFHNFELVPLLNDVPYMPPDEFIKFNVNPKQLYSLI